MRSIPVGAGLLDACDACARLRRALDWLKLARRDEHQSAFPNRGDALDPTELGLCSCVRSAVPVTADTAVRHVAVAIRVTAAVVQREAESGAAALARRLGSMSTSPQPAERPGHVRRITAPSASSRSTESAVPSLGRMSPRRSTSVSLCWSASSESRSAASVSWPMRSSTRRLAWHPTRQREIVVAGQIVNRYRLVLSLVCAGRAGEAGSPDDDP